MILQVQMIDGEKVLVPISGGTGNPLGTYLLVHGNTVPAGYLPMETPFDENQYPALYAMLGTNVTPETPFDLGADWDNKQSIVLSTTDYVIPENGWIVAQLTCPSGQVEMYWNDTRVATGRADNGGYSYAQFQMRVNKGDTIHITQNIGTNWQFSFFVPFKKFAHVVIKARSGLDETQQDYVLQSLNEAGSYSTEEVATGKKWIDGKTIYRKTYYSATNWANGTIIGTIQNLGDVVDVRNISVYSNGRIYVNYGSDSNNISCADIDSNNGNIIIDRGGGFINNLPSSVTVEYTKTT